MHKTACDTCLKHGTKIVVTPDVCSPSELFLFLKRYENASLYQCSHPMRSYIWCIIQISTYCFENFMDSEGIIAMIVATCLQRLANGPVLCQEMHRKFIQLVARVIVVYQVKWKNSNLKEARMEKGRHSKEKKKLAKLTHA